MAQQATGRTEVNPKAGIETEELLDKVRHTQQDTMARRAAVEREPDRSAKAMAPGADTYVYWD